MSDKTITIRGKKYPEPSIDRMKRKQAKQFQEVSKVIEKDPSGAGMDMLWEMVGILMPSLPEDVLDDLDLGECKHVLEVAGAMQFEKDAEPEPTEALGESVAS